MASQTTARSAACQAGGVTSGSASERPHSRQVSAALCVHAHLDERRRAATKATRQPAPASARASAASSVMWPAAAA